MTNKKTLVAGAISLSFLIAGLTVAILRGVNAWFETHRLVFEKPIVIEFNKPITIEDREVAVAEVIRVVEAIPHPDDLETDVEKYIYDVFGIEDYKVAIAIARSESGLREDAIGINANSVDVGIFQINSVHFKKDGCSLQEVVTMQGNVNCAKQIYDEQSWSPWVVWQTSAFKAHLE